MLPGTRADVFDDSQLLLLIYMYNYLKKNGLHESANALVKESQKVPEEIKMSIIQSNGGFSLNGVGNEENFLYEWWCALWSFQSTINPNMNQTLNMERADGRVKPNAFPTSMPPPSGNRPNVDGNQNPGRHQSMQMQQYMLQQQMLQQQGMPGPQNVANVPRMPHQQPNAPLNNATKNQANTRVMENQDQSEQKSLTMKQQQEQQQRYHEQLLRQQAQLQAQQNMHMPPSARPQGQMSPQQTQAAHNTQGQAPFQHSAQHSPHMLQQNYPQKPKENRKKTQIPSLESQNVQNPMGAPGKHPGAPATNPQPRKKSEAGHQPAQSPFTTFVPSSQTVLQNQQFPEVEPVPNAQVFDPHQPNNDAAKANHPAFKDQFNQSQHNQANLQMQWQRESLKFMQRQQDPSFPQNPNEQPPNPGFDASASFKPQDLNQDLNVETNSFFDSDWFGSIGTDHGF